MRGENLGAYLLTFGELAPWQPVGGGAGADVRVLGGIETDPIFNGMVQADKPAALLATTDAAGMRRGDAITIDSVDYTLRTQPRKIEDGAFSVVELECVE